MQRRSITRLAPGMLLLVVVAGAAALFATYWDDAWHTDLGGDSATIPPRLLLYGSVAVIGAAWHAAFGRDAVLWSPPHLLGVFGTLTLIVSLVAGTRPGGRPWLSATAWIHVQSAQPVPCSR